MENTNNPGTSELEELIGKYSPYFHEIRRRIRFALVIFLLGTVAGFVFYERIIKFLIDLLSLKGINIVFTSPFQFINLAVSCGLTVGLVLAFPLLIYQILSFLKPALKVKEFKMMVRFLPFCVLLFTLGFSVGFFIMKWQIEIFLEKSISLGIGNILDISQLISTVLLVSVLMGMAFQLPIIVFILIRIGVIKAESLSKQRLWIYIGSLIFAILLPPDSVIAAFLLATPLIVLFEITLLLNRIFNRKVTMA